MKTIFLIQTQTMLETILTTIKTQFIILLSILLTFFAPVFPLIVTTFSFILFDTIMGVWKAKCVGEKINSNGLKRGFIPKVIIYSFVLIIVFMADKFILNHAVKQYTQFEYVVTKIVALILIFIECWSIDENFKAIYQISIIEKFQSFLKFIKGLFKKFLDNENN